MQIDLFEDARGARWRQLPEEAREHVIELLAKIVLECVLRHAEEGEADDDR
jgi:hypothetical protein